MTSVIESNFLYNQPPITFIDQYPQWYHNIPQLTSSGVYYDFQNLYVYSELEFNERLKCSQIFVFSDKIKLKFEFNEGKISVYDFMRVQVILSLYLIE